eukprot:CAMPEP_0183720332 /NCGR_PEP_ID=MMETSP0737-20130205/12964_1 /TAXON_ID=385413 /ORGANISM="Thalassiosira miniscula, Strain CCMP1093" /LENGTH=172 /DNA_ID=CAMNT_0025950177 /DNA_START=123 /DNA_END=638 /DNA_ORIENTATION=+
MVVTEASSIQATIAGIFCMLLATATEAWSPSSHHTVIINARASPFPVGNHMICDAERTGMTKQSATQLSLIKYKNTELESSPPIVELNSEQDQILRDCPPAMEEAYGVSWFEQSEAWDELKNKYPILQEYTNGDLRRAFIAQKPNAAELLTKTPLGPFLLLNGVFWLGGFSW